MILNRTPTHTEREPAIRVVDLHKTYRHNGGEPTPVLKGIDLGIQRGECVFLAGPSGSGKTTLLSILGCILKPDQGHVRVLGQDLATLDGIARVAMRRDRLGFVFQRFHLIRGLNVAENVSVPLILQNETKRHAACRARQVLREVGMEEFTSADPRRLSAGQCQRVALARALANDPDLILADEPTASLDADNGLRVMELLRKMIKEKGKTAVVVTHDQRIFRFADRVCRMEDGCLLNEP